MLLYFSYLRLAYFKCNKYICIHPQASKCLSYLQQYCSDLYSLSAYHNYRKFTCDCLLLLVCKWDVVSWVPRERSRKSLYSLTHFVTLGLSCPYHELFKIWQLCTSRELSTAPFPPSHHSALAVSTVGVFTANVTHSFFFNVYLAISGLSCCTQDTFLSLKVFHCDV